MFDGHYKHIICKYILSLGRMLPGVFPTSCFHADLNYILLFLPDQDRVFKGVFPVRREYLLFQISESISALLRDPVCPVVDFAFSTRLMRLIIVRYVRYFHSPRLMWSSFLIFFLKLTFQGHATISIMGRYESVHDIENDFKTCVRFCGTIV